MSVRTRSKEITLDYVVFKTKTSRLHFNVKDNTWDFDSINKTKIIKSGTGFFLIDLFGIGVISKLELDKLGKLKEIFKASIAQ